MKGRVSEDLSRADRPATHARIVIIGTGFAGLGMAIRLRQEAIKDFIILERGPALGGVWRDNVYPGCACDVESHLYSFSFAPNPTWSRAFSPQREIWDYLRDCADRFQLLPHVRFDHEVLRAAWDASSRRWNLQTSRGAFTAEALISAGGALSDPLIPELPGLSSFTGEVMHSARWDSSLSLKGRSVAVIGTGASAIQLVPAIQPEVKALTLFQRTAPWILPRGDRAISPRTRRLFRAVPFLQRLLRGLIYAKRELMVFGFRTPWLMRLAHGFAMRGLRKAVKDPTLRAKLTPRYALGCKRILISDNFLPAVTKDNVHLVTSPIQEVRALSLLTADGVEHAVDTLIFGTGFRVTDLPLAKHIHGRDGRTLEAHWEGSPKAYLGTTIAGFPNFFLLSGPNTGLGHSSVLTMVEAQVEHTLRALQFLDASGHATLEPRLESQEEFVRHVDRKMRGTVWVTGGCSSWYLDKTGRNSTLWPTFISGYRRRAGAFKPSEYHFNG